MTGYLSDKKNLKNNSLKLNHSLTIESINEYSDVISELPCQKIKIAKAATKICAKPPSSQCRSTIL